MRTTFLTSVEMVLAFVWLLALVASGFNAVVAGAGVLVVLLMNNPPTSHM